jgi:hypothetical protein
MSVAHRAVTGITMSIAAILAPVFVQVALTFALMWWMGAVRYDSVHRRETRIKDIALGQDNWPPRVAQIGNAFNNQFQMPVLFYVLVILAYLTQKAGWLFVIMSWLFVILRIAHAGVHVTTNNMGHRFGAYLAAAVVLMVMWIIFAFQILFSYQF